MPISLHRGKTLSVPTQLEAELHELLYFETPPNLKPSKKISAKVQQFIKFSSPSTDFIRKQFAG